MVLSDSEEWQAHLPEVLCWALGEVEAPKVPPGGPASPWEAAAAVWVRNTESSVSPCTPGCPRLRLSVCLSDFLSSDAVAIGALLTRGLPLPALAGFWGW